ncbi:hypothetical protein CHARACLAT_013283 [Characodon lateralis]|uniref:Uncharacterized protein n=1 Tax=Characodon lateralis TaxID=208331 RepID=A0ABU7ELE7_9TELE|nr:hypothetical protein [Characodon lateralis]
MRCVNNAVPYFWSNSSMQENNRTASTNKRPQHSLFIPWFGYKRCRPTFPPSVIIFSLNVLIMHLLTLSNRVHISADAAFGKDRPLLCSRRKSVILLVTGWLKHNS